MNRLHTSVAAFTCAALLSSATLAAAADVECMRPGKDGTVLNLSATASVELANDQAVVNFYAMDTAPTLLEATQKVLKRVNEGLAKVKALDIKAEYETTNLSSYPRYNEPKKGEAAKIVGWEVRQNISGTVKEVDDAAKLAQQAAKYFAFDGVQFSLSKQAQRTVQEQLMREALTDVRTQAKIIASELGTEPGDIRVESINFNRSSYGMGVEYKTNMPMMSAARAMDSARMPLPQFDPGKSTVSRQVSAQLRIDP